MDCNHNDDDDFDLGFVLAFHHKSSSPSPSGAQVRLGLNLRVGTTSDESDWMTVSADVASETEAAEMDSNESAVTSSGEKEVRSFVWRRRGSRLEACAVALAVEVLQDSEQKEVQVRLANMKIYRIN